MGLTYQAEQTMTVTNLHSLATSPTAGWQSAVVDNTGNLYFDYQVQVVLAFANTAPGTSRCAYVFVYSGNSSVYTNPVTGSEGTLTLPDVTANPLALKPLGIIPYVTQNETVESEVFSVCQALGLVVAPPSWGIAIINHSGAALAASGSTAKYRGVLIS